MAADAAAIAVAVQRFRGKVAEMASVDGRTKAPKNKKKL